MDSLYTRVKQGVKDLGAIIPAPGEYRDMHDLPGRARRAAVYGLGFAFAGAVMLGHAEMTWNGIPSIHSAGGIITATGTGVASANLAVYHLSRFFGL